MAIAKMTTEELARRLTLSLQQTLIDSFVHELRKVAEPIIQETAKQMAAGLSGSVVAWEDATIADGGTRVQLAINGNVTPFKVDPVPYQADPNRDPVSGAGL